MPVWGADARYTRLIEKHGRELLHLALMLMGNIHDAEDIVQDAVISVAAAWPTAQPRSGLAYLKRAVSNRAVDYSRRRTDVVTDVVPERSADDLGFLVFEEDREFFVMVDRLPHRQREAVILRYYADLNDSAIAETLGCSVQTVRSQIHHALTTLRRDKTLLTASPERS
jgi:RNA polymerase sigma factor (sigma-70 family)